MSTKMNGRISAVLILLVLVQAACSFPLPSGQGTPTPQPSSTPPPTVTVVSQPSETPVPATETAHPPTATSIPPSPLPPTSIPPTPGPVVNGIRVNFAPGATQAVLVGNAAANQTISYLVRAAAGQLMMVFLSSTANSMVLAVTAPNGAVLAPASANLTNWQGQLPVTGDYVVQVISRSTTGSYNLGITIPARISFQAGSTSAQIPGHAGPHETVTYLAYATGGQVMTVSITSPNHDIFLTIYGMLDGSPLVRSVMGRSSWSGTLPMTQDYVIEAVNTGDYAEDFLLKISIQ